MDLLTTGVDVPVVRNIVFFKYVRSPIAFYQMIGRGTRLDPASGKLMFRVYDYTAATRLFGEAFRTRATIERDTPTEVGPPSPAERTIQVQGIDVRLGDAGIAILTTVDGVAKPVTLEEYKERIAESLVGRAPTLDAFRATWIAPAERRELLGALPDAGRSAPLVRAVEDMADFDLYDVLAELGYGLEPKTRIARADAFDYKAADWLADLPPATAATLRALARQFARAGTDELENPGVLQTPDVAAGGLAALKALGSPAEILHETKSRLFAAEDANLLDRSFFFHALRYSMTAIRAQVHGATMQHITKPAFKAVTIPLPPLDEQRRIAGRLREQLVLRDPLAGRLSANQSVLDQLQRRLVEQAATIALTAPTDSIGRLADSPPSPSVKSDGVASVIAVTSGCLTSAGWSEAGLKAARMNPADVGRGTLGPR